MSQPLETYQDEIYLTGLSWAVPAYPTDLSALEDAASKVMTPRAFDYVAGAAGSGDSARENLAAFRQRFFRKGQLQIAQPNLSQPGMQMIDHAAHHDAHGMRQRARQRADQAHQQRDRPVLQPGTHQGYRFRR